MVYVAFCTIDMWLEFTTVTIGLLCLEIGTSRLWAYKVVIHFSYPFCRRAIHARCLLAWANIYSLSSTVPRPRS